MYLGGGRLLGVQGRSPWSGVQGAKPPENFGNLKANGVAESDSSNEICCIYWFKIVFEIVFTGSKLGMFGHVRACSGMPGHVRACPNMPNFHHTDLQESSEGHVFQHTGYIFSCPPPLPLHS